MVMMRVVLFLQGSRGEVRWEMVKWSGLTVSNNKNGVGLMLDWAKG